MSAAHRTTRAPVSAGGRPHVCTLAIGRRRGVAKHAYGYAAGAAFPQVTGLAKPCPR